jgi:hypothetical protein
MNKNVFVQYPKDCLLKAKQNPIDVSNPPKKPTTRDKIEPLGSQRVGPKNKQLGVTWLIHLVMLSRMGKCQFQHLLFHLKE